ncbi:MAG: helix-turn-helix transcriptional regulator, partial [Treponema sp.]|nr:helix-turn-helix transcriptional regulator [Treponema sp.]
MNAYDMLKMIDSMNMQYWHPIGATTLYETCLRLEKKGLIEDSGKADNKTVYRITDAGRAELKSTIRALFERVDYDSVWFCLAVMYSGVLTKKELEAEKKKRAALLDEYEKGTIENRDKMLAAKVPYIDICAIDRMIQIIQMEKETLGKL